jgi:hypothetical protein
MIRMKKTLVVQGVTYTDGETYPETAIPPGSLVCLLRMGQAERVEVPPVAATPEPPPAVLPESDPPKPAAKKAGKPASALSE